MKTYEITFINHGRLDQTQICTRTESEARRWFLEDFCKDEKIPSIPDPIVCLVWVYNEDDAEYYGQYYEWIYTRN